MTTPNGSGQSSSNFTVTTPPARPTISGFTPTSGKRGSTVTINGTNFTGATLVRLGFYAATFTVNSTTDTGVGAGLNGDLRYCLDLANVSFGDDTINFTVSGTITLAICREGPTALGDRRFCIGSGDGDRSARAGCGG